MLATAVRPLPGGRNPKERYAGVYLQHGRARRAVPLYGVFHKGVLRSIGRTLCTYGMLMGHQSFPANDTGEHATTIQHEV